jgi:hypothetical protein
VGPLATFYRIVSVANKKLIVPLPRKIGEEVERKRGNRSTSKNIGEEVERKRGNRSTSKEN